MQVSTAEDLGREKPANQGATAPLFLHPVLVLCAFEWNPRNSPNPADSRLRARKSSSPLQSGLQPLPLIPLCSSFQTQARQWTQCALMQITQKGWSCCRTLQGGPHSCLQISRNLDTVERDPPPQMCPFSVWQFCNMGLSSNWATPMVVYLWVFPLRRTKKGYPRKGSFRTDP